MNKREINIFLRLIFVNLRGMKNKSNGFLVFFNVLIYLENDNIFIVYIVY